MPTYEYACTSCGEHLEVVQGFSEDPLAVCPNCGGPLRKVFGNIGIVLKGSGFYKNDSRPAHKSDSGAKTGGDGSTKESSGPKEAPAAADGGSKTGTSDGAAPAKDAPTKKPAESAKTASS